MVAALVEVKLVVEEEVVQVIFTLSAAPSLIMELRLLSLLVQEEQGQERVAMVEMVLLV
jgi:hypothetical protein